MPPVRIEPLSSLPAGQVRDYLIKQGHEPAIIDWKYFDSRFNRDRVRGFAGVQDSRLVSFLGLIPFTARQGGQPVEAAWSCDWYKDPEISGPLGIMLIRQSMGAYPLTYSLGGSEMTRAIMGRLARLTVPAAGVELYRPLRVGGALQMLHKATGRAQFSSLSFLNHVPLPTAFRIRNRRPEILTALPSDLPRLFEPGPAAGGDLPWYDLPYLQWLLERCPALTGGVCVTRAQGELTAAVLFWRPVHDRRWWRICPLPDRRSPEISVSDLMAALHRTLAYIRKEGGWLVSLLASHLDEANLHLARRYGFVKSKTRRPFYVLTRDASAVPAEPRVFSYLDTDYAYRFPDFADQGANPSSAATRLGSF